MICRPLVWHYGLCRKLALAIELTREVVVTREMGIRVACDSLLSGSSLRSCMHSVSRLMFLIFWFNYSMCGFLFLSIFLVKLRVVAQYGTEDPVEYCLAMLDAVA